MRENATGLPNAPTALSNTATSRDFLLSSSLRNSRHQKQREAKLSRGKRKGFGKVYKPRGDVFDSSSTANQTTKTLAIAK